MSQTIPLQPLFDKVVVTIEVPESKSAGGILLAESKVEKPTRGTVVAVGPGKQSENGTVIPVSVAVGDEVVFSVYSPESVTIDSIEYYIIREESILAIVKS